ncbi:MAG: DNA-binding domain-containing protein [Gammaproteobacteria bacterium]|nr:DNA-binding domain-containing protein [Gammaproteobacteria bacterium]
MSHLRDLQLRFQDYLIDGSEDIEQDIISTEDAIAEHRLGTYYNAYRIRLIDCLAVDYPALEKYLGREAFENMALDYLQHFPSCHASVRWFGENLPAFLGDVYRGKEAEFLEEMARYEWAQTTVFDAADSVHLLQLEDMATVPVDAWPGLTLKFKPALIWLDLLWNVPLIENALDSGTRVPQKQRDDFPRRWMLWRRELKIQWRSLEVHEAWAIEQAANGANFAAICEGLLEWIDEQQVALAAAGLLKQWVGDQLVLKLDND